MGRCPPELPHFPRGHYSSTDQENLFGFSASTQSNPRSSLSLQDRRSQLFVLLINLLCVKWPFLYLYARCAHVCGFLPLRHPSHWRNPSQLLHDGQVTLAFVPSAIIIPPCFPMQGKGLLRISSCKAVNRKEVRLSVLSVSLFLSRRFRLWNCQSQAPVGRLQRLLMALALFLACIKM